MRLCQHSRTPHAAKPHACGRPLCLYAFLMMALVTGVVGAVTIGGCVTGGITRPVDPVEDGAKRSIVSAYDSVQAFLTLEHAQREWIAKNLPDVHTTAERLRRDFYGEYDAADKALRVYKLTRKAADAAAAESANRSVQDMASDARVANAAASERSKEWEPSQP